MLTEPIANYVGPVVACSPAQHAVSETNSK